MTARAPVPALSRLIQIAFFAVVIGLWSVESLLRWINPILFPRIGNVAAEFGRVVTSRATFTDIGVTLATFGIAFAIATMAGIVIGYVVGTSTLLARAYEPLLAAIYTVPLIVFFPTFILFFGSGITSKVAIGSLAAFFPIALNTIAGFSTVDHSLRIVARSLGASRFQLLRRVLLPAARPFIVTGLRIAFIPCFASVLAGEIISSNAGLGHAIAREAQLMETARMFAYILLVILIAAIFNLAVSAWEARRGGAPV